MFWETKLLELQKLAPVELAQTAANEWIATMKAGINRTWHKDEAVVCKGETRAAAVVGLWNHLVNGHEPFLFMLEKQKRKIRWNAKWEVLEEINEPTELVTEEQEETAFDPAD